MHRQRVLLVDPSGRGGLVKYTEMVARSLVATGTDVSVLGSRVLDAGSYDYPFFPRMPNLRFGSDQPDGVGLYAHRAGVWLGGATAALRTARELRPDIVHFQHAINRRLDRHLVQRLGLRAGVVWTAHDVLPHERTPGDKQRFAGIYRAVDAVLVHSEPAAELVDELSGVEAVVVPHPVDASVTALPRDVARDSLGLPRDERIFGALGFIRAYKGYDLLVELWQRLGARAPRLLVMGELHSSAEESIVAALAMHERADVRLGFASDTTLEHAVAACDALLLPYSGGSDSGLLHLGRALGTPVIASDAPQLAASVRTTRSGLVVPREVDAWLKALLGPLPPAPEQPPSAIDTGRQHLAAYRTALRRATARWQRTPEPLTAGRPA